MTITPALLAPILVTLGGLARQGSGQELVDEANAIFDALQVEAESSNPPGFHMPDMVAVIATRN